jgi:HPt (histidine-containing phosphotransfer) domain-containing protein
MPSTEIDRSTFDELKQMSGADFIGELIDTFLDDGPKMMTEIRKALKAGDAEAFRRAAHSLKSNAATFGANRLSQLAKDLEMIGKDQRLVETGNKLEALQGAFELAAQELRSLRS